MCLVDFIAEGRMLSFSRSFWRRGDTSWLSDNFFRHQDVVGSVKWRLKENNNSNIPPPLGLAVGMGKEQKEKEPVENEEKNMATATLQVLMLKVLLQPQWWDSTKREGDGGRCLKSRITQMWTTRRTTWLQWLQMLGKTKMGRGRRRCLKSRLTPMLLLKHLLVLLPVAPTVWARREGDGDGDSWSAASRLGGERGQADNGNYSWCWSSSHGWARHEWEGDGGEAWRAASRRSNVDNKREWEQHGNYLCICCFWKFC